MPCSAVTVDYRRDSAAMPVPITRSILEPEFSRLKYTTLSSSCTRRPSGSSPLVSELVQKYSSSRYLDCLDIMTICHDITIILYNLYFIKDAE